MKKKTIFILLFLIIIINFNVKAAGVCTNDELARLKKIAEKVDFSYDYEIIELKSENGYVTKFAEYTIKAVNLNPEINALIIKNIYTNNVMKFERKSDNTAVLGTFHDGDKIVITIEAYVKNECSGKKLLTKTIKLPYYNSNSQDPLCEVYSYCDGCDEFSEIDYNSVEKFENALQECITKENKQEAEKQNKNDEVKEEDHSKIIIISGAAILVIAVSVVIIIKIKKKNNKKVGI